MRKCKFKNRKEAYPLDIKGILKSARKSQNRRYVKYMAPKKRGKIDESKQRLHSISTG